ncbi:MAG: DUF4143 domain-containing protein [Candidatus Dependentiae bacterium]
MRTYIERDVRTISSLRNIDKFQSFLRLCGMLSSQEVNYSQLGRELGLTSVSAQEWTHLLKQSFQWRSIQPYYTNEIKRISRKPKGYITDTGLLCNLLNIQSPDDLRDHSLRGAIFETWVVNHIHQLATQLVAKPLIYHWRSLDGGEVDVVLDHNGMLYPIEIKLTQSLRPHDLRGIQSFRRAFSGRRIAPALIIYGGDIPYAIDENTFALPWHAYCLP